MIYHGSYGSYRGIALLLVASLMACSDQSSPPMSLQPKLREPKKAAFTETSGFPDSAEFVAANIPLTTLAVTTDGVFLNSNSQWRATGHLSFTWANDVTGTETVSLKKQPNGEVVNSGQAGIHWVRFELPVPSGDTTLLVPISTLNRHCGLTGKHSIDGTSSQIVTTLHNTNVTMLFAHQLLPG